MSTRPGFTAPEGQPDDGNTDFAAANPSIESFEHEERFALARGESGFDRLVSEMASRFAGIDPNRVDDTIVDILHRIVETLGLDRGIVWRRTRGEINVLPTHCWVRLSLPAAPDALRASDFPWVFSTLDEGAVVVFGNRDDILSGPARDSFERCGLRGGDKRSVQSCQRRAICWRSARSPNRANKYQVLWTVCAWQAIIGWGHCAPGCTRGVTRGPGRVPGCAAPSPTTMTRIRGGFAGDSRVAADCLAKPVDQACAGRGRTGPAHACDRASARRYRQREEGLRTGIHDLIRA
jgi:hypothetical protein